MRQQLLILMFVAFAISACDEVLGITTVQMHDGPLLSCPVSYTRVNASCYRIVPAETPQNAFDACEQDQPGSSHLVALDTFNEYNDVADFVVSATGSPKTALIGGVQRLGQPTKAAGWLSVTGGALITLWAGDQPNDGDAAGDPSPEDGKEQLAAITVSNNLMDVAGVSNLIAICEYDGKAIDEDFRNVFVSVTGQ